jgi:hypothetical protein
MSICEATPVKVATIKGQLVCSMVPRTLIASNLKEDP